MKTWFDFKVKGLTVSGGWFSGEHFKVFECSFMDFEEYEGKVEILRILSLQIAKLVFYIGVDIF
jgi:hypothetical protein